MRYTLSISLFLIMCLPLAADFGVRFEELVIPEMPGLQSFAVAEHGSYLLLIGGRTDGLHRRQQNFSFDISGQNDMIYVVDINGKKIYSKSVKVLPAEIAEQFSSSNMEFTQVGEKLYLIGGYAFSAEAGDHITFPYLTVVDVPKVIDEILNNNDIISVSSLKDERFAVTGGRLLILDNIFYLVGGQKFTGRYNPMGHNTFVQDYTCAIRKFTVDEGSNLAVTFLPEIKDCKNLHRRDFNVLPQIFQSGVEGITAFTGVFQMDADLPFLDLVNIDSSGFKVVNGFSQYLNHYHTASISFFDEAKKTMYNVFMGGIAQYYLDDNKILVRDDNVPFVKTISLVKAEYNSDDVKYTEQTIDPIDEIWTSSYLGAGAEFIPSQNLEKYGNAVLKLNIDNIDGKIFAGYLIGGISSTKPNVFFDNTINASVASGKILKVYLTELETEIKWITNIQSNNSLKLQTAPMPAENIINISYQSDKVQSFRIEAFTLSGEKIHSSILSNQSEGMHQYSIPTSDNVGIVIVSVSSERETAVQKVIVR